MLQSRDSVWWLATGGALFRFPPFRAARDLTKSRPERGFTSSQGSLDNVLLYPLHQDSKGDLWLAAWWSKTGAHELYRRELAVGSLLRVSTAGAPSLKHKSVTAITEDGSGKLWIGVNEGGLVRGGPNDFAELAYLTTESIQAIHFDGAGRLWVGSVANGVTRVDDPASDRPRLRSYSVADGLSSNHVWCITEDRFGRIYMGPFHEPAWLVGPNGNERQINGLDPSPYFREMRSVAGIAGEVNPLCPRRDDEPAP